MRVNLANIGYIEIEILNLDLLPGRRFFVGFFFYSRLLGFIFGRSASTCLSLPHVGQDSLDLEGR
jgi:hypothetical protein